MRIRRSASRLLGSAASGSCTEPPRFEPPLPPPAPPAHESRAGSVGPATSSGGEPCCELSRSPWDLMAQLDLSDPQVEKLFVETCFISVSWRGSWLFPAGITMPAGSGIEEREELAVDMVDGIILKLRKAVEKMENRPKPNKGIKVKKGVWRCRKNDGKRWCCRRPTTEPNSYCSYHSDQKLPISDKPRRKRPDIDLGEGFYYYAGFGPGTKRRRTSSSDSVPVPELPLPPEPLKEEAADEMQLDFSAAQVQAANESVHQVLLPPSAHTVDEPGTAGMACCDKERRDVDMPEPPLPAELPKEEAQSEMQLNFSAGQAQDDDPDHEEAPVSVRVVDKPARNDGTAGIAGWDEESSDDETFGCNGDQPREITKRKSAFKKRWRKPVKARSLKSLMSS